MVDLFFCLGCEQGQSPEQQNVTPLCCRLQVTLAPAPTLQFIPNPELDGLEFVDGLDGLIRHIRGHGFYGGIRLLQARRRRSH